MCWSRGWRRATNTSWQARNIKTCNRYCRLNIYVISSCHRTGPDCNTGNIFRVFHIFQLIPRAFRRVKYMRKKGNICQYSTREHAITALFVYIKYYDRFFWLTSLLNRLTHSLPMHPFYTPSFSGLRKVALGTNRLI